LLLRLADRAQKERSTDLASRRPLEKYPEPPLPESLTQREVAVLRLLARGQTNREIAQTLSVAVSTVKNHVQHVIAKLGVSDRTQAAVRAIELGLVQEQEEELL
jgi:DNA-binding NarL/FixJ family response regulator